MSKKYTGDVKIDFPEETSALLPCLVAANVASDYADTTAQDIQLQDYLNEKFANHYSSPDFGKKFIKGNEKAWDLMISFMRHWSEDWLQKNYPTQYAYRIDTHESKFFKFTKRP